MIYLIPIVRQFAWLHLLMTMNNTADVLDHKASSILYFGLFHFDRSEFYWVMEMNNFSVFHYILNLFLNFNEGKAPLC